MIEFIPHVEIIIDRDGGIRRVITHLDAISVINWGIKYLIAI